MDTLVWQMLASVAIPGYTIHTIVAAVHAGLLPLEATQGLLDLFASAAPSVGTTPEVGRHNLSPHHDFDRCFNRVLPLETVIEVTPRGRFETYSLCCAGLVGPVRQDAAHHGGAGGHPVHRAPHRRGRAPAAEQQPAAGHQAVHLCQRRRGGGS